jgi:cell wall-associated NlpC family hydrolase
VTFPYPPPRFAAVVLLLVPFVAAEFAHRAVPIETIHARTHPTAEQGGQPAMSIIKIAAIAPLALLLPVVFIAAIAGAIASVVTGADAGDPGDCAAAVSPNAAAAPGLGGNRLANAATIVAVGKQLGVPGQGQVVAITAAITESGLENLDHGDRDSLGLLQQRPSQGWGFPAQILNPTYAATQFYRHLLAVPGWQRMSVNDAAQAVENSGRPTAYAPHEHTARQIAAATQGSTCNANISTAAGSADCDHIAAPNPTALAALDYACAQRGRPYLWGGNGPAAGEAGFDCSGLTHAAYAAAGIRLPRVAQAQYDTGAKLPAATTLQPGDLVFFGTSPRDITHVGIAISPTQIIDAPDTGQIVRIDPLAHNLIGATRPSATP